MFFVLLYVLCLISRSVSYFALFVLYQVLCLDTPQTTFPQMYGELQLGDGSTWAGYARSSQCEQEIPPSVAKHLTLFQQLLVVQATRADRLQSAMALFACKTLGTAAPFHDATFDHFFSEKLPSLLVRFTMPLDDHFGFKKLPSLLVHFAKLLGTLF